MTEATAERIVSELKEKIGTSHVRKINKNVVTFMIEESYDVEMPAYEYWYVTDITHHTNGPVRVNVVQK